VRAGPKAAPTGRPLALGSLPKDGGDRVIAFVERYCRLPKGGKGNPAGESLRLRAWQRDIIHALYDPDPRPRQGLVSVARKNGKSLLAACLALYHLLGDGEQSAEVVIISVDERTARVIFNLARRMVELDPRLSGILQVFADRLYHPASDSVLEALPGEWARLQGRNPSFTVADELHVMDADTWDALSLAGATRARPLILGISTECEDDDENLMARLVEHGRTGEDPDFFFVEFTASPGCDLTDRAAWAQANPQLGDTLEPDHLAAMVRTTREPRFRRFHLNQRVALSGAWLSPEAWAACADATRAIPDGAEVVLGFDGSYNGDCTVITVVSCDEQPHVDLVECWERPEAANDWSVPIVAVEDAIRAACRRWQVRSIVGDAFRWARTLELLAAEGLPTEVFPQTAARMTPATSRFHEAVVNGALTHSGDSRLTRHVRNAVLKEDARGARLAKPTSSRVVRRPSDAAVAAVMAYSVAAMVAPGAQLFVFDDG
jgi:phage terminase large subunit-like protein